MGIDAIAPISFGYGLQGNALQDDTILDCSVPIAPSGTPERGEEGSKCPSCLSLVGKGGAEVPFFKGNIILF